MEQKDMAVGFRIEHLREDIDKSQYGAFAGHKALGAADYKLTSQAAERGVFTFVCARAATSLRQQAKKARW